MRIRLADPGIWAAFLTLGLVWGSSFLFIKIGLEQGLPPLTLVSARLWIAVLFLSAVALGTGARLPRDRDALWRGALLGVVNVALPFSLITWGELWIDSALASILNGLVPLMTIVLGAAVLHDEPITISRLGGLLVGFGGAVLILGRNLTGDRTADATLALAGELAVVAACVSYAGSAVFIRRSVSGRVFRLEAGAAPRRLRPVEIGLLQTVVAAVIVTVAAVLTEGTRPAPVLVPPTALAWLSVAWLGALGSGLAYLLFFRIIAVWDTTRTALVTYLMPVVGIALGVLVLGERIDARVLLGTVLVVGGIVLVNSRFGQGRLIGRGAATGAGR